MSGLDKLDHPEVLDKLDHPEVLDKLDHPEVSVSPERSPVCAGVCRV